jgi:hypothetical protein
VREANGGPMDFDEHNWHSDAAREMPADVIAPLVEPETVPEPRRARKSLWIMSAVLVVVVGTAVVAVAGSGSRWKSAVAVLSDASARTTGSGTAHITSVETVTGGGVSETPVRVEGDEDFKNKTASVTIFNHADEPIESLRSVRGVGYVSTTLAGVPLPGGAHWMSITPADEKADASLAGSLGSSDPSSGLQFLSAIAGDPRVLDHDAIDGVKATHYAFTLNLQSYFDRVGSATTAMGVPSIASALEQLKALVDLTKLPGEAWIDADGRVRRFTLTIELSEGGQTIKAVADIRFTGFGEPLAVAPPAAADTVPFRSDPHYFSDLAHAVAQSN